MLPPIIQGPSRSMPTDHESANSPLNMFYNWRTAHFARGANGQEAITIVEAEPAYRVVTTTTTETVEEPRRYHHEVEVYEVEEGEEEEHEEQEENMHLIPFSTSADNQPARPGHPHKHGHRVSTERQRLEFFVCKCNHPETHTDAFERSTRDMFRLRSDNRMVNWETFQNALLTEAGKEQIDRDEYLELLPRVLHPAGAEKMTAALARLDERIRRGKNVHVKPDVRFVDAEGDNGRAGGFISGEGVQIVSRWDFARRAYPLRRDYRR